HAPGGDWRPAELEAESLQLAVARGAAYFGLVRRGLGVRIGGGAARTYYLGLGGEPATALCIVPRGMEEGESVEIADRELELLANRPVTFPLYTATDRSGERAGELVRAAPDALSPLPPLRTVVRFGRTLAERALPAHLEVRLTEIGTLGLWCRSLETEHRWRLEFRLRDIVSPAAEPAAAGDAALVVEPARLDEASALLRAAFESGDDPVTLTRRLEAALDAGRDAWPLAAIRTLWDALWPLEPARARSAEHEARWLNLAGFLLRPGFGDAGDEVRVGRLWRVLSGELRHPRAVQCRAEWWNLWKRIAGGLTARQQQHLLELVGPALLRRGKPSGRAPRPMPSPSPSSRARRATAGATSISSSASGSRAGSRPPRTANARRGSCASRWRSRRARRRGSWTRRCRRDSGSGATCEGGAGRRRRSPRGRPHALRGICGLARVRPLLSGLLRGARRPAVGVRSSRGLPAARDGGHDGGGVRRAPEARRRRLRDEAPLRATGMPRTGNRLGARDGRHRGGAAQGLPA